MLWEQYIPGYFGIKNNIFLAHPNDRIRALAMLKIAFDEGAELEDILFEIKQYLATKSVSIEHVESQIERAINLARDFLASSTETFPASSMSRMLNSNHEESLV